MRWVGLTLFLTALAQLVGSASLVHGESAEQVRAFTRAVEFDFADWTLEAAWLKIQHMALGVERYMDERKQSDLVRETFALIQEIQDREAELSVLHADPNQERASAQIEQLDSHLDHLYTQRGFIAPIAENVLQAQVAAVVANLGLSSGGQTLPPLLFHTTPLPWALIVSPRDRIAQEANISLETRLTLEDHIAIEDSIASAMDFSTLVVPIGGVGTYPTMVGQSSNLNWIIEVAAHEWIHNYLTLRPLGFLYDASSELTTMNETTANIAGKEIGALVIERYYPELVPPPPIEITASTSGTESASPPAAPVFDFRSEMHDTRVRVDEFLAAGEIEEAEEYMEVRRLFLWENGYIIRKLNQAYFAFYGSYADAPVGPAGEDLVGAAVRELRARSDSLAEFIARMASMTSFADLQELLATLD
ncbi:MAG: hypothetical protein ACRDFQ_09730 [Anaerolineales bacterium]